MIFKIEQNQIGVWEVIRLSDGKVVSHHDTEDLARQSLTFRIEGLNQKGNVCDCGNWKAEEYDTCYECSGNI
jgi:hypothetical protein